MDSLFEKTRRESLAWPDFYPTVHPVVEFYGCRERNNKYACFSNFYKHDKIPFTIPYCCWNRFLPNCSSIPPKTIHVNFAEQSIMLCKAAVMGDVQSYQKIANASTAREAKQLGRKVQNFDEGVWQSVILTVAFEVVYQKFLGLASLQRTEINILVGTNEALIVEAAPGDFIWGIGYPCGHPYCQDPRHWGNGNVLGFALMKARHKFRESVLREFDEVNLITTGVHNFEEGQLRKTRDTGTSRFLPVHKTSSDTIRDGLEGNLENTLKKKRTELKENKEKEKEEEKKDKCSGRSSETGEEDEEATENYGIEDEESKIVE